MKPNRSRENYSNAQSDITAANYVERAMAFIRANGGNGFVIRAIEGEDGAANTNNQATEPEWIAWMNYLETKGIAHRYLENRGMGTVPCQWPEDFDAAAPTSDRHVHLPPPMATNRRVGPMNLKTLSQALKPSRPATPPANQSVGLHDLSGKYDDKPPLVSDRLNKWIADNFNQEVPPL